MSSASNGSCSQMTTNAPMPEHIDSFLSSRMVLIDKGSAMPDAQARS